MKIDQTELKSIKSKIPSVFKIINEDFDELKKNQKSIGIKIFAVTLWDRWLSRDEYDQLFFGTKKEDNIRRDKYLQFYSELVNNQSDVYTWKYHKRKQVSKIRKLTAYKKSQNINSIKNYDINCVSGTFDLIIPEFSSVVEMKCDWLCILICIKTEGNKVFDLIKKSGLKYFEYY